MTCFQITRSFQKRIQFLSYDCCTAIYFLGDFDGVNGADLRQIAVDTVFGFYRCGLISSPDWRNPQIETPGEVLREYLQRLLKTDPYDGDLEHHVAWMEWDFYPTKLGGELVELFKLRDDETRHLEIWKIYKIVL